MNAEITLVTAFYLCDDNPLQISRAGEYLANGAKLLSLPYCFTVFCEQDTSSRLQAVIGARANVRFIDMKKDDLPLMKSRKRIEESRKKRHYYPDPRNTPEYMIITCSKPFWVGCAARANLHGSTYFAWVDFGLLHACRAQAEDFENVVQHPSSLLKCAIVESHDMATLRNLDSYYSYGRPGLVGGLWMADHETILWYEGAFARTVEEHMALGYGHGDEQAMFQVYLKNPDRFRVYPADYGSVLANWDRVRDRRHVDYVIDRCLMTGQMKLYSFCLEHLQR